MHKVRLTKLFNFEMAHALHNYDGLCKHIHGHSYKLAVTIIAEPETNPDSPKLGMVMDFGDLKEIVNRLIVKPLDHALMLSKSSGVHSFMTENPLYQRMIEVDYQPTCENMVVDFAEKIKNELPSNIKLFSIKLHETATSFAEWYASDNE